jgi:hypothetical protein
MHAMTGLFTMDPAQKTQLIEGLPNLIATVRETPGYAGAPPHRTTRRSLRARLGHDEIIPAPLAKGRGTSGTRNPPRGDRERRSLQSAQVSRSLTERARGVVDRQR